MLLLFLDTETSDLTPTKGQIVEVAGALVNLNEKTLEIEVVEEFSSLVKTRHEVDEKLTRLTGITLEELAVADPLLKVQSGWAEWLDPHLDKIKGIIGHSIDFDINFLKSESWLLPEKAKLIDTLDLAKILFVDSPALNLEFLIEKLKLEEFLERIKFDNDNGRAHRALYDTECCISLFEKLIKRLNDFHFEEEFYEFFSKHFLPINITFYGNGCDFNKPKNQDGDLFSSTSSESLIKINWRGGEIKKGFSERLDVLLGKDFCTYRKKIIDLITNDFSKKFAVILGGLYVSSFIKEIFGQNKEIKINLHERIESQFLDLAITVLEQEILGFDERSQKTYIISKFEDVLWQIKDISQENFDIIGVANLLDIYISINSKEGEIKDRVNKLFSAIDFFVWSARTFTERAEYKYDPTQMKPEEGIIVAKLNSLISEIENVFSIELSCQNDLEKLIEKRISELKEKWQELNVSTQEVYTFKINSKFLTLSKNRNDFDLAQYFKEFKEKFSPLSIETHLDTENLKHLISLTKIDKNDLIDLEVASLGEGGLEKVAYRDLENLLANKMEMAREAKKPVLILGGQNSVLKESQRICINNFRPAEYLVLGESGSLTKIGSKLARGFVGVCVVKVGDFGYFSKLKDLPEFSQIWIVKLPYMKVHDYWFKIWPGQYSVINEIRQIYLHSQSGFIKSITGQDVKFWDGS